MCKNLRKFKIKVQFSCSVSQANTMKHCGGLPERQEGRKAS